MKSHFVGHSGDVSTGRDKLKPSANYGLWMFMVLMLLVVYVFFVSHSSPTGVELFLGCTSEGKLCCGTYITNSYRKDGLDRGMWSHEKYLC